MNKIALLENGIQDYDWGSLTAISELLGRVPGGRPEAEMWMGAHAICPSRVLDGETDECLDTLISRHPRSILGRRVAERFGSKLPFLFKVLAAEKPLSIQAHPDVGQARAGFARESAAGIPLDAPHRNYRDDNHKPEIIAALTPFWVLKGFRPVEEITAAFRGLGPNVAALYPDTLTTAPDIKGLRNFYKDLMEMEREDQKTLTEDIAAAARAGRWRPERCRWMLELNDQYPGDAGIILALTLNLIRLEAGQALFLPAGELHSYLSGTGIELMANSDNVLRGGLTPKHVDPPELLAALSFSFGKPEILAATRRGPFESFYETRAEEFELSMIEPDGSTPYHGCRDRGVEIALCVEGQGVITDTAGGESVSIGKGSALLIPASVPEYTIAGSLRLFRASVP